MSVVVSEGVGMGGTDRPLDLEHSRPIRWDRVLVGSAGEAFINAMVALLTVAEGRIRARRADDARAFRDTVEALVADLLAAASADPSLFLAYSRDSNAYRRTRYDHPRLSVTTVAAAADLLIGQGLADGARGFQKRSAFGGAELPIGRQSRIRATPRLMTAFDEAGLSPRSVGFREGDEIIRLKARPSASSKAKRLQEYEDDGRTEQMRADLVLINGLLADTQIDLEGHATEFEDDDQRQLERDDRADREDRSAYRLHRVFNGDWESGGRFYGGWWMGLTKKDRSRLLLDGETTVELDYRAMHARLCYHLEGLEAPPGDPYILADAPRLDRQWVKGGFTRLLNTAAGKTPRDPFQLGTSQWRDVLRAIERNHEAISGWFRGGRGLKLQHLDSLIANIVLTSLASRGIPCLPVHDSFIVPASKERALGEAMCLAYWGQVQRAGGIKAWPDIAGWSASVEQEVRRSVERTAP